MDEIGSYDKKYILRQPFITNTAIKKRWLDLEGQSFLCYIAISLKALFSWKNDRMIAQIEENWMPDIA
jgi:hypothetical protein